MKKVNAYKLSDGRLIESRIDASAEQRILNITDEIENFCENNMPYNATSHTVARMILDHIEELEAILREGYEEK